MITKVLVFWTVVKIFMISVPDQHTDMYGRSLNETSITFEQKASELKQAKVFDSFSDANSFIDGYYKWSSQINSQDYCKDFIADTISVDSTLGNNEVIQLYIMSKKKLGSGNQ